MKSIMFLGLMNDYNSIGSDRTIYVLIYAILFILSIIYYISLTKLLNVTDFSDNIAYLHQAPCIIMFLLGFVYHILWYVACIHLIAHFLSETLFI